MAGADTILKQATETDLAAIGMIASAIHPELTERREVFAEKLELFPQGCLVLVRGGVVAGYALSHPWLLNRIPPLDEFLGSLPPSPDCIFIHDVAVAPEARGRGNAQAFVELVSNLARAYAIGHLALVSVYESHRLWSRFGFAVVRDDEIARKLKPYGETACYMVCDLDRTFAERRRCQT
jgi:GNAT superfamily N-acetyltransferase